MEKNKITVFVAGQKLTLITTDTEKYVSEIAQKVDTTVNSLLNSSNMSREKCAVMAALDFCDDEAKARVALNELKEQIKDYIADSSALRAENEELKEIETVSTVDSIEENNETLELNEDVELLEILDESEQLETLDIQEEITLTENIEDITEVEEFETTEE